MDQESLKLKDREFTALINSENEINEELHKTRSFKKFLEYGLLNHSWYQEYKVYLKELKNGKNKKFQYDIKSIDVKTEQKFYFFENDYIPFNFVDQFEVVNKNFINLLSENFKNKNKEEIKDMIYNIVIGGNCMICKDCNNDYDNYIFFYEKNKSNKIDFWLRIKDEGQRKKHFNLILNNLWNYLGIIN